MNHRITITVLQLLWIATIGTALRAEDLQLILRVPQLSELSSQERKLKFSFPLDVGAINEWYELKNREQGWNFSDRITDKDLDVTHVEYGRGREKSGRLDEEGKTWPISWTPYHNNGQQWSSFGDPFLTGYQIRFKHRYHPETLTELVEALRSKEHAYLLLVASQGENRAVLIELESTHTTLAARKFGGHVWFKVEENAGFHEWLPSLSAGKSSENRSEVNPIEPLLHVADVARVPTIQFSGWIEDAESIRSSSDEIILHNESDTFRLNELLSNWKKKLKREVTPESLRSPYALLTEMFGYKFTPTEKGSESLCQKVLIRTSHLKR
jgi:hypothetical protein